MWPRVPEEFSDRIMTLRVRFATWGRKGTIERAAAITRPGMGEGQCLSEGQLLSPNALHHAFFPLCGGFHQ